ncbi:MAG: hypothetical protein FWB90_01090 [Fibromonadales bacterium]|nr:hypothetical protein [Fibromonadales bacterium]
MGNKLWAIMFAAAFFLISCTHWFIDTETRLRVKNLTSEEIHGFSIISKNNNVKVLIKDISSERYEGDLVGEFNFAAYLGDSLIDLGVHKLKGGVVYAEIYKEEVFKVQFRK